MSEAIKTNAPDESKRVNLEELAHYMGYAVKEDTERAIEAVKSGRLTEATNAFSRAEQVEKQGVKEYVDTKRAAAEEKRSQAETELLHVAAIATKYGIEASNTSELERKVETARQELAKKYERYGAKPEDFNLVTFERDGKSVQVVMYTASNGLDLGNSEREQDRKRSYNSIMSGGNEQAHLVVIDGKEYDARSGMTLDVYKAFVEAENKSGHELPDSEDNTIGINGIGYDTWTLLTGEPVRVSDAGIASVRHSGSLCLSWAPRGRGSGGIRFRPAVEL